MSVLWIFFLLIFHFYGNNCTNNKLALSHITLLLPYTSDYLNSPTRFRIRSHGGKSNGCVSWSISPRKGIISIINSNINSNNNNNNKCASSNTFNEAIILAISSPENGRVSATITAFDSLSHETAECEVFIDKVNTLQVATSTRLIYLGKYESIEVNGFDNKGNKFSTLSGLPMIWRGIGQHLQKISFSEASLMLPDTNSDIINSNNNPLPVKGILTGQEDVIVTINTNKNSAGYAHFGCNKANASLYVVMQLQLIPRIAYISKCTKANFNLITTSHNELDLNNGNIKINKTYNNNYNTQLYRHKLQLPNNQYKFKLINHKNKILKMSIKQNGELISSNIIENGKLLVEDKVTSHESIENTADARIYIVNAYTIYAEIIKFKQYKIRPNIYIEREDKNDWYLTYNQKYLIRLTLYDKELNPICIRDLHNNEINFNNMKHLKNLKSFNQEYICSQIEWNIQIINHKNSNKLLQKFEQNEFAQINHINKDINEFTIIPNKISQFTLKFSATGMACKQPEPLASSMKKVIITSPVFFQNSSTIFCPHSNNNNNNNNNENNNNKLLILIPYTGDHNIHKVPIFFSGGSNRYRLEINDTNIANILNHNINNGQNDNVAILHGNNIGHTYLFIIDYYNPDNFAFIHIEVEWIKIWKLSQNVIKEILINNFVQIPIIIRDQYNRQFSSLHGMKQVISASSINQMVSLEFIAPNIHEIIEQQLNPNGIQNNHKNAMNSTDTHIIKNVAKEVVNNLQKGVKDTHNNDVVFNKDININCNDMNGIILVGGISEGYDEFIISLNEEMYSKMFVSVYKPIKPLHKAVAIGININEPYTMHWSNGPLAWPIKQEIPVDNQFVHPLQVDIRYINDSNNKYFGFNYNGKTLEFICYKSFHSNIELTVSNRIIENNLLYPILSIVEIEIFCLPQFKFNSSVMEMGVGTRKNTNILYPSWINGLNSNINNISSEFYIEISQIGGLDDIISVKNNDNLQYVIAKRLGSSFINGKLKHLTDRVYIHSHGFEDKLEIIVLFKGFTIEMSSYWIINGAEQIAHIEGLDENHHILPFRHNFDNVFIEWISEDANIIELLSILPLPNPLYESQIDEERNNIGNGLSIKLKAHSVGLVNIKAIIKLRNAPKSIIKTTFELIQTITVIPQVIYPCNSIILSPNTSLLLSPIFNPDINIEGIGQIYNIQHKYSHINRYVYVENKKLNVRNDAPIGENIIVTLILESPNKNKYNNNNNNNNIKQYPLTQAASLIVSIVQPTGLNLLKAEYINDNIIYTKEITPEMNRMDNNNNQPFWSYNSYSSSVGKSSNKINIYKNKYSKTENILCENQNITLKIAILDELARELNVIDQCKVVSNDTSIVLPRKDIKIITENIGGPMYAIVHLDALQPGYVTITFREKDPSSFPQAQQSSQPAYDNTNYYVYDDPKFLRTFLNIHVLSTNECKKQFDIIYKDNIKLNINDTNTNINMKKNINTNTKNININNINRNTNNNKYKNNINWQSKISLKNKNNQTFIAIFCIVIFILIIGCTWGNCCDIFGLNNNNNQQDNNNSLPAIGYNQNDRIPPAAFNPYASLNNSNTSFQSQSFNTSNSFYM